MSKIVSPFAELPMNSEMIAGRRLIDWLVGRRRTSQMNGGKEAPPTVDFEKILTCIVRGEGETSYVGGQRELIKLLNNGGRFAGSLRRGLHYPKGHILTIWGKKSRFGTYQEFDSVRKILNIN